MKKKLALSLLLAAAMIALAWWAFPVDKTKFKASLAAMNLAPLAPVLLMIVTIQLVRLVRWWMIVQPVKPISLARITPTALAGFLSITLFPLRAGEMVRPLLLRQRDQIPFSSGLATCVAERVVDALAVFVLLLISLLNVPARTLHLMDREVDLAVAVKLLLVIFVPAAFFLAALLVFRGRLVAFVERLLSPVSRKLASISSRILGTFVQGLEAFHTPGRFAAVAALTAVVWGLNVVVMGTGFHLFGIDLPPLAALAVLSITMAGITVPGGIGMSGNFQLFCVAALALYGVESSQALAYALVMNALMFSVAVVMGLSVLPVLDLDFTSLMSPPPAEPTSSPTSP